MAQSTEAPVTLARYVTVKHYSNASGLSEAAIRKRCERGQWLEGREWKRGPDGRYWIDTKGVEKWVEATA